MDLNLESGSPCYGRAEILDDLTNHILQRKRSTTLLYGDSGIGKTTVLEALRDRIRTERIPDAFCGFYECEVGKDADPAIPCFRDLLDHHLAGAKEWEGELRIAIGKAVKNGKNLANVQRFFLSLVGAAGELPVIGGAFKFASKAVESIREFTNLGVEFPSALDIHLPREAFTDLVRIMLDAFPNKKLVFLVDNVSADTESLATAGIGRTTDTIQAILQKDFRSFRGVHFVLSYKEHAPTRVSFKRLLRTVEENGGRAVLLDQLEDDDVRSWLCDRCPWFRSASPEQASLILRLAGGLPQIVQAWEEMTELNLDILASAAEDVRRRRYAALADEITEAGDSRVLLFQLTLMAGANERQLADVSGLPEQAAKDLLEAWRVKRLLKKADGEYRIEHETKREVALTTLRQSLSDSTRSRASRMVYDYYLSHVGLPSPQHPNAAGYLLGAFAAARGNLSEELAQLPARVYGVANQLIPVTALTVTPFAELLESSPPALKFLALQIIGDRIGETQDFADRLLSGALSEELETKLSRSYFAQGLVTIMLGYREARRSTETTRLLERISACYERDPTGGDFVRPLARALASLLVVADTFTEAVVLLGRLKTLAAAHPENRGVQLDYSQALSNVPGFAANQSERERANELIDELLRLNARYRDVRITRYLARGLVNSIGAIFADGPIPHQIAGRKKKVGIRSDGLVSFVIEYPHKVDADGLQLALPFLEELRRLHIAHSEDDEVRMMLEATERAFERSRQKQT